MGFEGIIGQERAVRVLRSALMRDRVAHSYLFTGPEAVGKSAAAKLFAQALNCEGEREEAPCGRCRSCALIERGNHPDVRVLRPGGGERKTVIAIKDLREQFVYDVQLKPVLGRYKVYLLDHAERTQHDAIHTILKTLEEPPPYVVTIIVTNSPEELPATIPSRCQQVVFHLVGAGLIEGKLRVLGLEAQQAGAIARLSGGRIAWAIRASQRAEVLPARRALLDLCAGMIGSSLPAALRIAEEVKLRAVQLAQEQAQPGEEAETEEEEAGSARGGGERAVRAQLPWCLDVMASWYRDLIAVTQGGPLLNLDYEAATKARTRSELVEQAECAVESILETKRAVERNANIDVALESLVLDLVGSCE